MGHMIGAGLLYYVARKGHSEKVTFKLKFSDRETVL